jgi:hypothetical protein
MCSVSFTKFDIKASAGNPACSQQDDTFPVSSLLDVHHVHSARNTGKNVSVKFNTEFEGYVWIAGYRTVDI